MKTLRPWITSFLVLLVLVVLLPLPPAPALAQEDGRWVPYAVDWVKVGDEFVLAADEAYSASLPENIQGGSVVFYIDGYTFTYKLSGGKMQWTDATGGETKSIGAVLSSVGTSGGKSVTYEGAFANTAVRYSAYSYGLKEEFVLYSLPSNDGKIANSYLEYTGELTWDEGLSVWVDGIEYPDKTFSTSSRIVFKDATGRDIAWLPAPYAWDSSEDEDGNPSLCDVVYDVKVAESKIQFGLRVPYSWLETAIFPVTIDPGWTNPTGHNDVGGTWTTEANVYDDNTATTSVSTQPTGVWGNFLELTVNAISCDKIRYHPQKWAGGSNQIDVDVWYEGGWNHVFQGEIPTNDIWYEKAIPAGTKSVTAARVRLYTTNPGATVMWLNEFDFNDTTTAPTVTTQAAAAVEETTATAHGTITDTGGNNSTTRGFKYGLTETDTWDKSENGDFGVGAYSLGLTGLSPGETYYVRAYATNSEGTSYGSYVSFTTKPNAPSALTISNPTQTSLELDWNKGTGAEYTEIRRKTGSYPANVADGDQAYYDTGTTFIDPGLSVETEYFYRAWSYTNPYSDGYSSATGNTSPVIAPTVSNLPATRVSATTARLNGTLDDDGGNTTTVNIHWGFVDGVTNPANWGNVSNLGVTAEGTFYVDISNLVPATTYYFRGNATNSAGTDWADSTLSFATGSGVGAPSNLRGIPEEDEATINLSWSRGANSTVTVIRYSTTGYPGNYTEGIHVCVVTKGSFPHLNLEPGTTYYYSAWGRSGTLYSSTYATGMATTVSAEAIVGPEAGNLPTSWFFDVDHTRIQNIPLYGLFGLGFDEFSIPRNTGFFALIMFFITVIGLALYTGVRRMMPGDTSGGGTYSLLVSVIVIILLMSVAMGLRIVPGFYAIMYIVAAFGIGGVLRRV